MNYASMFWAGGYSWRKKLQNPKTSIFFFGYLYKQEKHWQSIMPNWYHWFPEVEGKGKEWRMNINSFYNFVWSGLSKIT